MAKGDRLKGVSGYDRTQEEVKASLSDSSMATGQQHALLLASRGYRGLLE